MEMRREDKVVDLKKRVRTSWLAGLSSPHMPQRLTPQKKLRCSFLAQISDAYNIPTICQRLFLHGVELDSSQTIEELGLDGSSVVELLQVHEDSSNTNAWSDSVDEKSRRKGAGKRARGEGFGGTALSGGWEEADSERAEGDKVAEGSAADMQVDVSALVRLHLRAVLIA